MEQHQIHQMGALIAKLRKERNMTQKELAAKLGVTDKAVSKWERSLSYPDVTLLLPLAEALGITASELLSGEQQTPEGEQAVQSALLYSKRNLLNRVRQAKRVVLGLTSLVFALSIAICFLCDYCVTGGVSWSWIVLLSLAFAWAASLPLFLAEKNLLRKLFLTVGIGVFPYLGGLGRVLRRPMVFQLGSCIALLSIGWLWGVYRLFTRLAPRFRGRKLCTIAVASLLTLPLSWAIRAVTAWMLHEPMGAAMADGTVNTLVSMLAALGCALWDALAERRRRQRMG